MTTDRLLSLANGAYLLCIIFAALFSVVLWRLSIRSSEEAQVQITAADSRAAEANKRAADAGRDAAHANERAAALEKEASEAKERTAQAEERIAQLNLQIAKIREPRALTPTQTRTMITDLLRYRGQEFDAARNEGDLESSRFMSQLIGILRQAGWKQVAFTGYGINENQPGFEMTGQVSALGVVVVFDRMHTVQLSFQADALVSQLRKFDISATTQIDDVGANAQPPSPMRADVLHVFVGRKPL